MTRFFMNMKKFQIENVLEAIDALDFTKCAEMKIPTEVN